MSKMGQHVVAMQEDSLELSLLEFIKKYGRENVHIWEYIRESLSDSTKTSRPISHID